VAQLIAQKTTVMEDHSSTPRTGIFRGWLILITIFLSVLSFSLNCKNHLPNIKIWTKIYRNPITNFRASAISSGITRVSPSDSLNVAKTSRPFNDVSRETDTKAQIPGFKTGVIFCSNNARSLMGFSIFYETILIYSPNLYGQMLLRCLDSLLRL